jgi:hypothetical protein
MIKAYARYHALLDWVMVDGDGLPIRIKGRILDGYDKPEYVQEIAEHHGYVYGGIFGRQSSIDPPTTEKAAGYLEEE